MRKYWILLTAVALMIIGVVLHAIFGNLFSTGAYSFNYFASGDYAMGVFAAGKFSIGIFSIGIFSIGIFNVGLYALGLFVFAWRKRLPKLFINQNVSSQ